MYVCVAFNLFDLLSGLVSRVRSKGHVGAIWEELEGEDGGKAVGVIKMGSFW